MILAKLNREEKKVFLEMSNDLISLSSLSALQLNNLLRGREYDVEVLEWLVRKISYLLIPSEQEMKKESLLIALINPTAMIVMSEALTASQMGEGINTVNDVIDQTKLLVEKLKKVAADPVKIMKEDSEEIKRARDFCLTLSRIASSYKPSPYEREPVHPFRR